LEVEKQGGEIRRRIGRQGRLQTVQEVVHQSVVIAIAPYLVCRLTIMGIRSISRRKI
jgi:hypothetical protein